jgi:hypothetical protein
MNGFAVQGLDGPPSRLCTKEGEVERRKPITEEDLLEWRPVRMRYLRAVVYLLLGAGLVLVPLYWLLSAVGRLLENL